ncbi:DUF4224 domain-containing protein [Xanthomonas sp. SI]|uniref:DUF4224 domain-containing protein n=1 Tax=Xanthomonas sp. SI TaxID=2724123 RepID=UPI00163AD8AD|nr:DUF4224 domain-containing protein [Xanthomonas sp. SI]QNH11193.1 hypothetical protein HEP75_00611 [Xanthomonas sp. SI]
MELGLCLSRDEIQEFTRTPIRAKQLEFLRRNGIRHYLDNNGRPVVLRAAIGADPITPTPEPAWKPNKALP